MERRFIAWVLLMALGWAGASQAGEKTSNQFFYKPSLGARGSAEKAKFDACLEAADAHLGRYKTLGDPGYATLDEALSAIGSSPVSLVIPPGAVNLSQNATIPANVHLVVQQGGLLSLANGVTLTVNGSLSAGRYQIFSLSGTAVLAGSPRLDAVLPEWFGAAADGVTDDYQAVSRCLAAAHAWQKPVMFRQAAYKLNTLLPPIDVSKTRLVGESTILDFSGLPGAGTDSYAIQLYSSADYANRAKNRKPALQGLIIAGSFSSGSVKSHTGVAVGHASYANNAVFELQDVTLQGFQYNLRFLQNAYQVALYDCYLKWGGVYAATGLTNMGEKMLFANCFFADAGSGNKLLLGTGGYTFLSCSLDNYPLEINGDVMAVLQNCHLENPGSTATSGYWIHLNSSNGYVLLDGCFLIFNNPGSTYTNALFKVHDGNTARGFHIRNLFINTLWSFYSPETTSGHRLLVEGLGRVTLENLNMWMSGGSYYAIALYPNRLSNHDLELGNLTGWTTSGTGTAAASSTDKKNGTYSAKLDAASGQNLSLYQEFPVSPGQYLTFTFWQRRTSMPSGQFNYQIYFYNARGDQIGSDAYTQATTTTSGWVTGSGGCLVPKGTAKARLTFYVSSSSGTTTVYVDDVIVSVF